MTLSNDAEKQPQQLNDSIMHITECCIRGRAADYTNGIYHPDTNGLMHSLVSVVLEEAVSHL